MRLAQLADLYKNRIFSTNSVLLSLLDLFRGPYLSASSAIDISSLTQSFDKEDEKIQPCMTIEQTMERLPHGTRRLAAQLRTPLKFDQLWGILTDYDQLSRYIPNLVKSSLLSRDGNRVTLRQVGSQNLMGFNFSATVFLELIEDFHSGTLSFSLLKGDFRRFEGAWSIKALPNDEGCCLLYELTVQGCIGMPIALIEQRLRTDLKANLLAVEKAAANSIKNVH